MDQSKGERSSYHAISVIGRLFGPADSWAGWLAGRLCGTNSLDLMCNCKMSQLELLVKLNKLLKEREKVSSD